MSRQGYAICSGRYSIFLTGLAAIAHYCSKGNFRRAATHKQNLAELFEVELGDDRRAAAAYEEAAGWYESVCLLF
jgi:hypothetical protein